MVVRRESHDGPVLRVERPDVSVMFLEVADEPSDISRGWRELEDLFGSLKGRKFLGTFDNGGTYRVCVQPRAGDEALGLRTATVPGGRYLRARLRGDPAQLYERIPSTFAELEAAAARDNTRPGIEL